LKTKQFLLQKKNKKTKNRKIKGIKMEEYEEEEIKKAILQKKKQGMHEKDIIKFLELSGYPLRLLEEVNRTLQEKEEKTEKEEKNPLIPKVAGALFIVTALMELFYFFLLVPPEKLASPTNEFIAEIILVFFTVVSFSIGYGLYKNKGWAFNSSSILLLLRTILLTFLVSLEYSFLVFLIALNVILLFILLLIKPYFRPSKTKKE
jgi:cation transport ATPase